MPFWERRPDHPSVAMAEPTTPLVVTAEAGPVWCHFAWGGRPQVLPCQDPRLAASLERSGRRYAEMRPGTRIVVALEPPGERLLPQGRRSGRAPPLALPAAPSLSGGYDLKPEASSSDIAQPNTMRTSRRSPSIETISPATSSSISVGSSGS